MLRTAALVALALAIAFGLGVASVWSALDRFDGLSRMTIGEWSAQPFAGTADADPYSRARAVREASLPLGHAEGIAFSANRDNAGAILRRDCTYRIEGPVPAARFYTLHARSADDVVVATGNLRAPALHSRQLIRQADGTATVVVSPFAAPGNWLAITGSGSMTLVLTLYDSPVVASATIGAVTLPAIRRERCDG